LGPVIRARRLALGWSQEDLASRVAAHGGATINQSDISRLELGKVGLPRHARLRALAAALDLPLDQLLLGSSWAEAEPAETLPAPLTAVIPADVMAMDVRARVLPVPVPRTAPALSLDEALAGLLRLRAAIERSEETRVHTHELLAQSRAVRESVARPCLLGPRLTPQHAAASPSEEGGDGH
jgi:transcriptional regulator with XRE-family HTH domain